MSLSKRTARVIEELVKELELFEFERLLFSVGFKTVIALYSDGKDAIFGPIVTVAAIFDVHHRPQFTLTTKTVNELASYVEHVVDVVPCPQINALGNVDEAIRISKSKLVDVLVTSRSSSIILADPISPEFLSDALTVVRGDLCVYSLRFAALLARNYRQEEISRLVRGNPLWEKFELEKNLGHQSKQHLQALKAVGKTSHHRYYVKI